ncbi:hypothetical protein Trydic_g5338 [Trypoxylus dichotomus]
MDGIFPVLLQQVQDLLSAVLCTLLRATLAVGHFPSSWRGARVVFIIDKQLRNSDLGRLPLHGNQYAYQSEKSCEQAIHELARRAEIALRHKEIALATFLDIEGALAKMWSRANAHKVDHLHAKQQNSSCIHEPLQHRGDGGSRLPAGRCAIAFALVPVG